MPRRLAISTRRMQLGLFLGLLAIVVVAIAWLRLSARRGTPEETRQVLAERAAWIAVNRLWIGLAFGGGLLALTGLGMWAHAMLGETRDVDLARLEAGEPNDVAFARVHGFARGELAVCRTTSGSVDCHTPITSSPTGTRIAALLSSNGGPRDGEGTFSGMTATDNLWGVDEIGARGVTLSPDVLVVLEGETPEERRPIGLVILAIGGVLSAIGGFMLSKAWPRQERRPT